MTTKVSTGLVAPGTYAIDISGNAATATSSVSASTVTNGVYTTGDQTIAGTKTFSSAPVVPGINGGQLAGMRNKIINGKMEIAQRGTSFAGISSGAYSLDRWVYLNASTTVVTASQQSDVPSSNEFQSSLRFAVTTADTSIAAGDLSVIQQRIEGYNVRDLIGRTFTMSFWVRSSKTGTHCVSFMNSGVNRCYVTEYTISAANTWEFKTVTVSGGLITAGTWDWVNGIGLRVTWALAAGTDSHTTAGAWQTGQFYSTSAQVNCLDTIGNIFAITGVQLEVGSVATPFEHRPYGAELALCQRYLPAFVATSASNEPIPSCTLITGTTTATAIVSFPVKTRVPATGISVSSAGNFVISDSGSAPALSTLTFGSASDSAAFVNATASGWTPGRSALFYSANASARLLFTGCEL